MNAPLREIPSDDNDWLPGKLWSLWDIMINFQVSPLCGLLWFLRQKESSINDWINAPDVGASGVANIGMLAALGGRGPPPAYVPDAEKEHVKDLVEFAGSVSKQLEIQAALDRVETFKKKMLGHMTLHEFLAEVRVLRETIEQAIQHRSFYYYSMDKLAVLNSIEQDWKIPIQQFSSAKKDIFAAVDCWALRHSTASVFHLMRIAEYGLRALARERRVKLPKKQVLEWADWHTIITEIRKKVTALANKPRGPKRDAALEFYQSALGSFEGFKDAYRNNVMHSRRSYNSMEALALMHHVRDFMNRLGSKTDEQAKKQINWGVRA